MPTSYPGGLDAFTNPTAGDMLDNPPHDVQHANANDAVEAIEAELGTAPSGGFATVKARIEDVEARLGSLWKPAVEGVYDDYFDTDLSAGWTAQTVSGTAAWAYRHEARLGIFRGFSAIYDSQTAGDVSAQLKSIPGVAIGDYVQCAVSETRRYQAGSDWTAGIAFTDGTGPTAQMAGVGIGSDNNLTGMNFSVTGTLTANAASSIGLLGYGFGIMHLRVGYTASNQFSLSVSLNGEDWVVVGTITPTLTPSHVALFVAAEDTIKSTALFHYFHSDVVAP